MSAEVYFGKDEDSQLAKQHGMPRRSGRYPWGSGDDPYQHEEDFLSRVEARQKEGLSEKDIAKEFGLSTTELRLEVRVAKHARKDLKRATAERLRDKGCEENGWKPMNVSEVARYMGYKNESSVRALLNDEVKANRDKARTAADILKKEVTAKGAIDVGVGVELELGISRNKLDEAIKLCELDGYVRQNITVPQPTDKTKRTTMMALTKPDITQRDMYEDPDLIKTINDYHSRDGGATFDQMQYPASIDHNRLAINYADTGTGLDSDGTIFIRRGVADLDLGSSNYAQVRILVDGTHYIKGMAMYSDDIPEGKDIQFNTNKTSDKNWDSVLKEIKTDEPDNPFGASITAAGQSFYIGKDGKEHLSAINKLKAEGDWESQSKTLSQQFLSKQPIDLIKRQLDYTYKDYVSQFEDICKLENPTIKKKLLDDFADTLDGATVHLKAAAFPRQKVQVILPVPGMKDDEIYAPNYENGTKVALIRYPHAGLFEIPVVTVNNKAKAAEGIMDGGFKDAVGINPKVAAQLSGADFDGDTVTVIPFNDKVTIRNKKPYAELQNFDAKSEYAERPGMKLMPKKSIGKEMGMISNLINDMTLQNADEGEIIRAVKHSMVVIDAYKHHLDYKRSEQENGIAELKLKYQPKYDDDGNPTGKGGGAHTLLSKRKNDVDVPERKGAGIIDKDTGEVTYRTTGRKYYDKDGKLVDAKTKSSLLLETKDLHTLSSGTIQEELYADYGNQLKALANEVRKTMVNTPTLTYSPEAYKTYRTQVDQLNAALNEAAKNAPRERQAQRIANSRIKALTSDDMDKAEIKKISQRQLTKARAEVGASGKAVRIQITDDQWEAIQAGAIHDSKLAQILRYSDTDRVRQLAMPRQTNELSSAKQGKISAMRASGYTIAEIAESMGVSTSTVSKYI